MCCFYLVWPWILLLALIFHITKGDWSCLWTPVWSFLDIRQLCYTQQITSNLSGKLLFGLWFLPKTENSDFTWIWNICSHLDLTGKVISLFGTKACCTFLDQNLIKSGSWVTQNERNTKMANFLFFWFFPLLTTLLQFFASEALG